MKAFQLLLTSCKRTKFQKHHLVRRNFAFTPTSLPTRSRAVHAIGLLAAFSGMTGGLAMCPLDEFERIEKKNVAYHHHLHPR
jgi:hypothetical protein